MIDLAKLAYKWQQAWENEAAFSANIDNTKPKYYVLEMFPYPSGNIHVGHIRNYSIGDVIARFMKASGYNVLHPMGWDAFGLPAENAAIANNSHPKIWTYQNIDTMKAQLKRIGFSYDWSREIATCDPEYYKHEQAFFLELYNRGLAYQKDSIVNWDPVDQTVLANEQVVDGKGWRSGALIEKKNLKGWFIKITNYAQELLEGLDSLNGWPDYVRTMQKNWIGRSDGAEIYFDIKNSNKRIKVFTTRPDTIFGASFIGLAWDHEIIEEITNKSEEICQFIKECKESLDQAKEKDQKAIDTGLKVTHPFDGNREIPILITNFVLKEYGTGAIFGCPAHDERDFTVAKMLGLPITQVVIDKESNQALNKPYLGDGIMINSDFLNGLSVSEAKNKIIESLNKTAKGEKIINYKIRDWGISRQRFWGCPIPIIYCKKCGTLPVPTESLPISLPDDVIFDGKGNPLENHPKWKHVQCHLCKGDALRETDTFDTFFESSWYFARFCDTSSKNICSKNACDYWMPVDQYIGGVEHAVMHLLYARFFTIVLAEGGHISCKAPFKNLLTQGMVLHATYKDEDGQWLFPSQVEQKNGEFIHTQTGKKVVIGTVEKMSKSKKNVVDPDEMLENYGADAIRLFCLSDSPPEKDFEWTENGIDGCKKFIMRLYFLGEKISKFEYKNKLENRDLSNILHNTIYEVTNDIKSFNLNKAIAKCRELYNYITGIINNDSYEDEIYSAYCVLIKLLNPYIPHITEEIWQLLGNTTFLANESWPRFDEKYLVKETNKIAIQINGKLKIVQEFDANISNEDLEKQVLEIEQIINFIQDKEVKKIIIVPSKIVNIVIK
jgi:leucyl-tRNA synthetase